MLASIGNSLRSDGRIVASIPNIRYYATLKALVFHKQWEYTKEGILDRTHFRFFTQRSIPNFFRESGYELTHMEGINPITLSWKLEIVFNLLGGVLDDTRYLQFACVARKPV